MRPDLAARYADERLPRYTSYPTAPQFSAAVGPSRYAEWLGEVPADARGSLYVHIPFCRRMCWYCGCNTSVATRQQPVTDYLASLGAEIGMVAGRLPGHLAVTHLHFGGGTPTIVQPAELIAVMARLRGAFDIRSGAEVAIEIDPRVLTAEMAAALGKAGFTRASLGVQSLDPAVQAAISRRQSFAETAAAVEKLRGAGIEGINLDLIYGLPHQTVTSCLETVRACLALRPDRFSVFGYAHVPDFKRHQRRIDAAALPGGHQRNDQAEAIAAEIEAAGYDRIGLDHFALPADAMAEAAGTGALHRNFQGYTTDAADLLIGLGASAIGRLPQGYVQNAAVTRDYLAAIARGELAAVRGFSLRDDDRLRADLIERLMCDFRVDIADVCGRHGVPVDAVADALPILDRLAADGVLRRDGAMVEMAGDARTLVRVAAAAFDAYRA
ncbi:MAG: oxygen-independent coproporphyrinogen III oxidase, partial [Bauldia sp.]|uniref:oxygen-independent coproporphyrinogen III oxidase n=1 Tax=Bauldia sp. TaxID=2575872 RepID=UPI001D79BC68